MTVPAEVSAWCRQQGLGEIVSSQSVGGGCINAGARLKTESGRPFFLKTNPRAPEAMFKREAEGLEALRVEEGPKVPVPFIHGNTFILLEDLQPAPPKQNYWETFGRQLAALHRRTSPQFGFEHDNYIGSTPQPNPWTESGTTFFKQSRLLFQAKLALKRDLLDSENLKRVEKLADQLDDLIPPQPASLIHGDLWSGNAISGSAGEPALIDPATHFGWAEAELGMTSLFGRFPTRFYAAYEEVNPLSSGWQDRLPIYNLYHLLNHLNLFGKGYLGQVKSILNRYT
jgi:fructosamine-3-kinase